MWSDFEGEGVDKESIGIGMLYSTRTYEFIAGVQSMASAPPEATGRHLPDHTTAVPVPNPLLLRSPHQYANRSVNPS